MWPPCNPEGLLEPPSRHFAKTGSAYQEALAGLTHHEEASCCLLATQNTSGCNQKALPVTSGKCCMGLLKQILCDQTQVWNPWWVKSAGSESMDKKDPLCSAV